MKNIFTICFLLAFSSNTYCQTLNGIPFDLGSLHLLPIEDKLFNHYLKENNSFRSSKIAQLSDDEFKHHIISFSPLGMLITGSNDSVVPAMSLTYEYVFDGGKISVLVPLKKGLINQSFYISPGFKFYPFGQGAIRYAIGPQFTFGSSMHNKFVNHYSYSNAYASSGYKRVKNSQIGFMINNSLNATISKRLYLGLDLGMGIYLYNSQPDEELDSMYFYFGPNLDIQFCAQAGLHFGVRL